MTRSGARRNGGSPVGAGYEQRRKVVEADLDEQAHVNNVVYVQWVMDIATAHWEALASPEIRAELAWVARRHEIDYLAPAVLGDEVLVKTRVGPAAGLTFERLTEIVRAADGRALVRSRTLWVPIDVRTGRPRRISDEVRALVAEPEDG